MRKTILLAEDSDDLRSLIKIVLESYEFQVLEATDGEQAVEIVKRHSPDLILMDLAMPKMDGITATEIIRSLKGVSEIPIIALTAYGEHSFDKAIEAGCNELIEKPADFNSLISMIEKYF